MSTAARAKAAEAALEIARTLRTPEAVTASLTGRAASTLCYGLAGTALLHACLAQAEPGSATTAATHWTTAARLLGNSPPDGIHTGPGALAASLIIGTGYLPPHDPHHPLLPRATAWLSARATALARHHHQRATRGQATPWAVYDAIKGLTGIGRVLLAAHNRGHRTEAEPGLRAALSALTHLILTPLGTRLGWWIPANLHPPTVRVPTTGAATTGLAHGIAGPLAFLATAQQAGHTAPGQPDAIHAAAQWLLTWQTPNHTWPPHISGDALDNSKTAPTPIPGRTTAWCYGTPGIATALTNAGHALGLPTLTRTATDAMNALAARPSDNWDTEGSALCHGSAGLLQTARRIPSPALTERVARLTLADTPTHRPNGFLTGRAGTALALADLGGLLPQPTDPWDCLILLS
ncbi:lanthionine synthetase C family protein [Streptomyces barkulensis]|uniref:lanthionine synthetase C family protein n=1 Tax=Streptomyces barkulensis TaxID=1257026 RepID=UPI000C6E8848|nr:lanthionine synthetase C family protein [Streptomyces barkulensis]